MSRPRKWYTASIVDVMARLPLPVKIISIVGSLNTSGYLTLRASDGVYYKIRMHERRWTPVLAAEHHGDLGRFVG